MLVPWVLAIGAAAWFGFSAHKAGRSPVSWGLGGAVFGLLTTTFVFGLGQAMLIPYSDHQRHLATIRWTVIAVFLIALLGWVLTASLRPNGLRFWRGKPAQNSPPAEAKPTSAKPQTARTAGRGAP